MFRTGHRTDHTAWVEPAPQPEAEPEPPVEAAAAPVATAVAATPTTAGAATTIGRGVTFDGTLRFSGTLRMSGGTFNGKVAGDALIVGDGATLAADAACGSIEIHGEAHGSLTARESVELRSPARVTADLASPSLVIEKGVLFEGTVEMRGAKAARGRKSAPTPE